MRTSMQNSGLAAGLATCPLPTSKRDGAFVNASAHCQEPRRNKRDEPGQSEPLGKGSLQSHSDILPTKFDPNVCFFFFPVQSCLRAEWLSACLMQ